jgi:hypothetical protein
VDLRGAMKARFTPVLLLLVGCPGPTDPVVPDPTPVPLVNSEAWVRVVDPTMDVFAAERPPDAVCDDFGWFYDPLYQSLAVQTDECDYPTLTQPTLEPLEPGDVVRIQGFHGTLSAPEPSEGYLAIAVDGVILWELTVAIPGGAAVIDEEITIESSFALGSELQFHLHNHGPNTWDLMSVIVTHAP